VLVEDVRNISMTRTRQLGLLIHPPAEIFSRSEQNYSIFAIDRRFNAVPRFFDENSLALTNFRPSWV
jgi:hypothetical protein